MASSSSSPSMVQTLPNSLNQHFDWSVIVLKNRVHTVYNIELHSRMTGTIIMSTIRKACKSTKTTIPYFHIRPVFEEAVLSSFTISADPEAQDHSPAVIIKSSQPLVELIKAFHDPSYLLSAGATLIRVNPQFSPRNHTDGHYHAILIKTKANRWLIAVAMGAAIVFASAIGYIVGHFTENAILGVMAGGTTLSVFAFIQTCMGSF